MLIAVKPRGPASGLLRSVLPEPTEDGIVAIAEVMLEVFCQVVG